jgi:hypothetical protein
MSNSSSERMLKKYINDILSKSFVDDEYIIIEWLKYQEELGEKRAEYVNNIIQALINFNNKYLTNIIAILIGISISINVFYFINRTCLSALSEKEKKKEEVFLSCEKDISEVKLWLEKINKTCENKK